VDAVSGLQRIPLRVIEDDRGAVLHMLRADVPHFGRFGEIYFSEVRPGAVKAWKRHRQATQRFAVPVGRIQLVVHDGREGSETFGATAVLEIGRPDAYDLVIVPSMLWYGFRCVSDKAALLANCSDLPHDPAESDNLDPALAAGRIPYIW